LKLDIILSGIINVITSQEGTRASWIILLCAIVIGIKKDDAKAPHRKKFPSNKSTSITMEEEEEEEYLSILYGKLAYENNAGHL
jgi:hypothetical protein